MGFTRYWDIKKSLDPEKFKEFSKACKLVCEAWQEAHIKYYLSQGDTLENAQHKSGISGWDGSGEPSFADTGICFNGNRSFDKESYDLSHETFSIEIGSLGFNFCKTARKPYDKQVEACLYLAEKFFGDAIEIRSDGDDRDSEIISFTLSYLRDNKIDLIIKE